MRASKQKITNTEIIAVITAKEQGLTRQQAAKNLGMTEGRIRSICSNNKISGWPIGSASHNQRGAANPNYSGGNSRATIGRKTKQVLLSAGRNLFKCERCGSEREVEQPRHHKDRNRKNNALENLEVLCVSCHNKEHMSEQVRDIFGQFS